MSYLKTYGKRKLQEGGEMPAGPEAAPAAGPEAGGGGGAEQEAQQVLQLAEATLAGDEAAAAELGKMLAPVIMQEVQAQGGGAEGGAPAEGAPAEGGAPVFKRGGQFLRKE
jgi:hypothetical protein